MIGIVLPVEVIVNEISTSLSPGHCLLLHQLLRQDLQENKVLLYKIRSITALSMSIK